MTIPAYCVMNESEAIVAEAEGREAFPFALHRTEAAARESIDQVWRHGRC